MTRSDRRTFVLLVALLALQWAGIWLFTQRVLPAIHQIAARAAN